MLTVAGEREPIVASEDELDGLGELNRLLQARESLGWALVGPGGEQIALSEATLRLLRQAVDALAEHQVVVVRRITDLTLDQAADLLNVQPAEVARLLEEGVLSARTVRSRERIRFEDVTTFKHRRSSERREIEAPDFALKDLSGNEVKLSGLRGKPVMINFWATWCPPCREEIPVITKMYHETEGGTKYEVLGVATSPFDTSTLKAFGDEFTMDFPLLPDVGSNVVNSYHVLPIPTTFFVDKDGIIRFIQAGGVTREMMEKWLLGD